jgi:hypothetical protein
LFEKAHRQQLPQIFMLLLFPQDEKQLCQTAKNEAAE